MSDRLQRKPILTATAVNELRHVKQQILDAVAGKLSERLVLTTVHAAVQLARGEAAPGQVLPQRVVALVGESMKALAQQKWKLDTALVLNKRREEGGHGISQ